MQDKVKPWNDRYSGADFYYGTEPNDFLKECASQIPAQGKVLCLAEGEGRNAVYLATLGYLVTAVDQSEAGLNKLKRLADQSQVTIETVVGDLSEFVILEDYWDAIVSIWCHVPPTLRQVLHRSVVKGLKSGGVLILESYHPRQLEYKTGGPPTADLMMTKDSLQAELKGLQFKVLLEVDRDVQEGKGHSGMSAVTQCLAAK
jgi:SAM-dependent methyltransferase